MKPMNVPSFAAQQEGYKVYQRFRGLDLSTDQTQIDDSRSPKMVNMISDSGGYPEVRVGWRTIHTFSGGGRVNSIYPFTLDGIKQKIVHVGTRLVRLVANAQGGYDEITLLSGLNDQISNGLYFGGDLWILTGKEFIRYDGIHAKKVQDIAYVPTTSIGCSPTGGGTAFEKVNLLTPMRKNTFVANGTAKEFVVDTGSIDSGSTVKAWLNEKEITSGISFNAGSGKVTFATAPAAPAAAGVANLTIQFAKTTQGAIDKINRCTIFTTFGVNTGSRVFLSGNADEPATEWYSGLNDPTYFPDQQFINVGTSSFAITNYLKYQGELLVIKEDNRQENTVWHHTAEIDSTIGTAIFPLKEGVSGVGGCARFSMQVLRDDPLFLSPQGVYAPVLTYGINQVERNMQCRSERINTELMKETSLKDAVSAVWKGYYLLAIDDHIWVADANQARSKGGYEWYYWAGMPVSAFGVESVNLYFGTKDGRLCRLNDDLVDEDGERLMEAYADDGKPINWEWRSKLDAFVSPTRNKTLLKRGNGILLKSMTRAGCELYLRTEKDPEGQFVETIETDRFNFWDVDFGRFSFSTTDTQQIIFKKKIKKFKFMQVILKGKALNESAGVYIVALHYALNDYAKKKRR